jgi:hypothetical protein
MLLAEQTDCAWILCYVKFNGGKTHPAQMGKTQIDAFLSHLATYGRVSASTFLFESSGWNRFLPCGTSAPF